MDAEATKRTIWAIHLTVRQMLRWHLATVPTRRIKYHHHPSAELLRRQHFAFLVSDSYQLGDLTKIDDAHALVSDADDGGPVPPGSDSRLRLRIVLNVDRFENDIVIGEKLSRSKTAGSAGGVEELDISHASIST